MRIECTECHDIIDTTAKTVVFPFVCAGCQKDNELLAAMAPAPVVVEETDNHSCDSASIENTTLLIEDLQNQLSFAKQEVNGLRLVYNDAQDTVEQLALLVAGCELDRHFQNLKREFVYAANRVFSLAVENGKLEKERNIWKLRAEIVRRAYDRASADRRYYRGKLKDAGIKA
jgi:hypothetical protein